MTMLELLEESPIIAAIKSWEGLEKSLKSECKVVFVLFGTICDIDQIVARIKDAGKVAIVHVDMIQGLSTKRVAVDFIAHNPRAEPSLGRMLYEAQSYLFNAPWYAIGPGVTIILIILGFSMVSEGLRSMQQ